VFGKLKFEGIKDRIPSECKDPGIPDLNVEDGTDKLVLFINENKLVNCPELEIEVKNGITLRVFMMLLLDVIC
jgi:hypothetical protein